jgi:hypothetical protein
VTSYCGNLADRYAAAVTRRAGLEQSFDLTMKMFGVEWAARSSPNGHGLRQRQQYLDTGRWR